MRFAEEKLEEAQGAFRRLDEALRQGARRDTMTEEAQQIVIDLDAAIPGVTGGLLGRALVLKAHCLFYDALMLRMPKFYDPLSPPRPPGDALACAVRGRALLAEHEPESLSWADSVIERLQPDEDEGAARPAPTKASKPRRRSGT